MPGMLAVCRDYKQLMGFPLKEGIGIMLMHSRK